MGASATRIVAEEFLTPPEFAGQQLAQRSSGQIGGVRLDLLAARGQTRLGPCYQQVPVRVLPPFQFSDEPAALMYLLNPTAGLMDGDGHLLQITARAGTRAVVTGQSATRIHPCLKAYSTQQWEIRVERGAELVVLPGPAIPYQGCRTYQRVRIHLEDGARLIWGDTWFPGRYSRAELSEQFQFDTLIQDLEVRRAGRLVFRDRYCWRGPWSAKTIGWHCGSGLASGSLFISGPLDERLQPVAAEPDLLRAWQPLDSGDTCIRWSGPPPEVAHALVDLALKQAGCWTGGGIDAPWLTGANHFARNHWFARPAGR